MANRLIRNTAILAKIEATAGVDAVPTGAANAMLVSNLSINPINANNVDRDILRAYLGGSEQLVGTRYVEMGFDVEFVGSGTVATAPAWGPLVQACLCTQTITATVRVDYVPKTTADGSDTVTIYWFDDGVLHKATGCRGNLSASLKVGEKPMLSFKFMGLYSTPTAVVNPATTLTSFKVPQVVTDSNSDDVTFGATHVVTTAPALVAGTVYPSQGIEIDFGNSVNFTPLLGGETMDITARNVTGKVTLDLTAAQEVAMIASVEAGTLSSVGLIHGTVANQKAMLWLPSVQLINPSKAEVNGKRMVAFDMRVLPLAGNDEVRLITSFA
ncbi:MAG: hypothetical protein Q7K57_57170 [Burkholderiaceae bacterium]|nr:hypothetical protein [Burkholderiaceae bacterium]